MAKLILIKHAPPQVEPDVPSHEWRLSPAGREKAALLAERLRVHTPSVVFTSDEPKAVETAQIVAAALGVSHGVVADLREHDRSNVPQMPTREFISSMALLFKRPAELVLGREIAEQARQRITAAIQDLTSAAEGRNIAVVTHGTVLALYLAPMLQTDPFDLWRRMGLPSFVVVDQGTRQALDVVERVE